MRVWITREKLMDSCAVWIELREGRMMWIMADGTWGTRPDADSFNEDDPPLTEVLDDDPDRWERIS